MKHPRSLFTFRLLYTRTFPISAARADTSRAQRGPSRAQHEHMEAPPREKRARAAFFREKDAKRAAKQQRKKDKLTEKISQGGATEKDVAPTVAQRSTYSLELSSRSNPSPANANSGPVRFGRFESCSPCPAHPTATQWSVSALWLVVPRCGRVVRGGSPRPRRGPAFRRRRACPWA